MSRLKSSSSFLDRVAKLTSLPQCYLVAGILGAGIGGVPSYTQALKDYQLSYQKALALNRDEYRESHSNYFHRYDPKTQTTIKTKITPQQAAQISYQDYQNSCIDAAEGPTILGLFIGLGTVLAVNQLSRAQQRKRANDPVPVA